MLQRQFEEIRQGGLPVLVGKIVRFTVAMLCATPVVLLVRALRPLLHVRFGPLLSDRIGHFAGNTELHLCQRDVGLHGKVHDIFYYYAVPICNQQLKKMWDRTLHISRVAKWVGLANRCLPGGERHSIRTPVYDTSGLFVRTPAHLFFTAEEENFGRKALREIGIPDEARFICFHARDSSYLNTASASSGLDWQYHNYRDSSIHNVIPAAEELARRGYWAIRMGAVVKERLNSTTPQIIDYATNGSRTDFLDIYLSAKCQFYLGGTAGICSVPLLFRRPRAFVNFLPLEVHPFIGDDIYIPKKLWLREECRFMGFREILDSGAGKFLRGEQYDQLGIEVVENTSEEITALAIEMDERIGGAWEETEENEALQRRFGALFDPGHVCSSGSLPIGAEFLRQNEDLLD